MARAEARILVSPPPTYGHYKRRPARERWAIRARQADQQQGQCVLCNRTLDLLAINGAVVDHCPRTDRVRGVLCCACNLAMAAIDRGDDWIARAVVYRDLGVDWFEAGA